MTRDDIKKSVRDTAEAAKTAGATTLSAARQEVEDAASHAGSALKGAAEGRAEEGRDAVSEHGDALADRLRSRAGDPDHSFRGRLLTVMADGVAEISDDLRGRSLQSILDRTEHFARRHPGAFVAGAALAGFSLARLAMASARGGEDPAARDPDGPQADVPPAPARAGRSEVAPGHQPARSGEPRS